MITLVSGLALAAPCTAPPASEAAPMGTERLPDTCLHGSGEVAGRAFARVPEEGLSRGVDLPRARVEAGASSGPWAVRGAVEALRSAGTSGYVGVAGEALIPVVQIAEARASLDRIGVAAGAGIVDDPAVQATRAAWALPALAASPGEEQGLHDRSDVGGWASWTHASGRISATVAVLSGEGALRRERNDGVDTTALVRVRPLEGQVSVELLAYGREGSRGVLQARDHRAGGGAHLHHELVVAGLDAELGWGLGGDGALQPAVAALWARTGPELPLLAWLRGDLASASTDRTGTWSQRVRLGAGPQLGDDARGHLVLGYEGRVLGPDAGSTPGTTRTSHMGFVQLGVALGGGVTVERP